MFSHRTVPTGRGFESFQGYYGGAEDYFTHDAKGANDMHRDHGAQLHPDTSDAGEYSTHLYARHASSIIQGFSERAGSTDAHKKSLFLYLAFQAIHSPDQ